MIFLLNIIEIYNQKKKRKKELLWKNQIKILNKVNKIWIKLKSNTMKPKKIQKIFKKVCLKHFLILTTMKKLLFKKGLI